MNTTLTRSYDKYEGRIKELHTKLKAMQTKNIELEADWKGFKYYKETEFRKVENRYLKLMHDFHEIEKRSKEMTKNMAIYQASTTLSLEKLSQ